MPPENSILTASVYWETEFTDVRETLAMGRQVFFAGGLTMYIPDVVKDHLASLQLPFRFERAIIKAPDWLEEKPEDSWPKHLWRVLPIYCANVDASSSGFEICSECGQFADAAWHVTRLKIDAELAREYEVFGVSQNRGNAMFVTPAFREKIEKIELTGIGFYPAGKMV